MNMICTCVLLLVPCAEGDAKPKTLVTEGYDQAEMDAAIARARKETDRFVKELENPTGESHSVKAPIEDGDEVEHFWLTEVTYRDGVFEGKIGNDPGVVKNVKFGQKWKLKKEEISDWMFIREDKIYGNYTMRPLLKTLPPEQAAKLRSLLAEP